MNRTTRGLVIVALAAVSCVDTGQDRVDIPLRVAGTAVAEPVPAVNGWLVELTRAELAFGPLYLCAGYQAGSLCDTARVEWVESAIVDALDPEAVSGGALHGVTGPVRSWMYDLGITSLLTQQRPVALSAARDLGGNSVVIEGVARKDQHAISFVVELPIQQEEATEIGASVVRKSGSDRFEHEVTGDETALTVRFDPRPWVHDFDFDALVEDAVCAPGGPAIVCNGVTERTCDVDGATVEQRDCAELGMACLRGSGCSAELRFAVESQGYRAVRTALVAGERPTFEWGNGP
jgi:hypothetical protein